MKKHLFLSFLSLSIIVKAQNTKFPIGVSFRAGYLFSKFESTDPIYKISDYRNRWNFEFGLEDNKFGLGLIVRYITTDERTFVSIKSPLFKPYIGVPSFADVVMGKVKVGDVRRVDIAINNFSFLVNKKIFLINNHRLDIGIGVQKRKAYLARFSNVFGWEIHEYYEPLDKYGILSRIGYTYMIGKHFSLSTNIEYSRFKMKPKDFWDFNILGGVRF